MSNLYRTWEPALLEYLRRIPVISHAAREVGIGRSQLYRLMKEDPELKTAVEEAMEEGIDRAEQEAFRRAVEGTEEPVIHQGHLAYRVQRVVAEDGAVTYEPVLDSRGQPVPLTVRKHSDALLQFVLKGRRKQVYADRTELTGADGVPLVPQGQARISRIAALLEMARGRKADPLL